MSEEIIESSGNIFEDIKIKDPEAMLRKARLVSSIQDIIASHGWT